MSNKAFFKIEDIADLHSHILPGMDDGAKNVETSVEMLNTAYKSGVRRIVATPHYDPMRESPDEFIARRKASEELLLPSLANGTFPKIYKGAEVAFHDGISRISHLQNLCIEGTDYILIEMPFAPWHKSTISEISAIYSAGFTPILAHTERYLKFVQPKLWGTLAQIGAIMQCNAEFFIEHPHIAKRKLKKGLIHVVGSDCHNLDKRYPNLLEGLTAASKFAKETFFDELSFNSDDILANAIELE